jgi:hypothetical protein
MNPRRLLVTSSRYATRFRKKSQTSQSLPAFQQFRNFDELDSLFLIRQIPPRGAPYQAKP